jgi:hypothetical protein
MMTPAEETPILRFAREFTERDATEAQDRGYLSHVLVDLGGGRLYPVFFYDAVRLQQDLEEMANHGRPYIAEPGMIVVQEITIETMTQVVCQLESAGFFDALNPVTEEDLASSDPYKWPPRRIDPHDSPGLHAGFREHRLHPADPTPVHGTTR